MQPESPDWRGPVVVVSALGGATDRLLGIAAEAGAGDIDGAREHLRALCATASRGRRDRQRSRTSAQQVERFIRDEFDELERIAGALGVLREVTPRWLDAIAATGRDRQQPHRRRRADVARAGLDAGWTRRRVMVTGARHTAAPPLVPETTAALRDDRRSAARRRAGFPSSADSSAPRGRA